MRTRAACRLSQTRGLGTRLACLPWSGSGTSGESAARGVRGVSAWCSRSVHVLHVVADQRLRGTTVPVQDGTGMEICNANCACATCWIVPRIDILDNKLHLPCCGDYKRMRLKSTVRKRFVAHAASLVASLPARQLWIRGHELWLSCQSAITVVSQGPPDYHDQCQACI